MAAVSVVWPGSMCPIVPTFTCGLLRSNFSFATTNYPFLKSSRARTRTRETYSLSRGPPRLPGAGLDDLLRDVRRPCLVPVELHRVGGPALRGGTQVGRVSEHSGERHACLDRDGVSARVPALGGGGA